MTLLLGWVKRSYVRTSLRLTDLILARLAEGPARPIEILERYALPRAKLYNVCQALAHLVKTGRAHKTRLVLTGHWGGNVASVYQLMR